MTEQTYRMTGDPTEGALVVAAAKAGALPRPLNHAYPRVQEVPFDSERKRMITVHEVQESTPDDFSPFYQHETSGYVVAIKGAPDVVLELCTQYQRMDDTSAPLTEEQRMRILKANDQMTQEALRVLGVAYRVNPDHARCGRSGKAGRRPDLRRIGGDDRPTSPGGETQRW